MKKALLKGLAVALFFATVASSSAWAESNFTITKADGTPATKGTNNNDGDYYVDKWNSLYIVGDGLTLSGTVDDYENIAVIASNITFTLKNAHISSSTWNGALVVLKDNVHLVIEGANTITNTGTEGGVAITYYNGAENLTISGKGELYATSQAEEEGYDKPCIFTRMNSGTETLTVNGLSIKGSTAYNASRESLVDATIGTCTNEYIEDIQDAHYLTFLVGSDCCNTVLLGNYTPIDADADYVVVTYKEGSETKTATYKAADVEKVEWKKGADISE